MPHYFCTAVMMPSVLRYNKPATREAQNSIAAALRAPGGEASEAFAAFIGKLGLPRRLSDVGVREDKFRLIGENAMLSIDDVHHQLQGPQGRAVVKQRSVYTIVTCLPIEADGRPRYRIKSKTENIERVVTEEQISRLG